MEKAGKAPKFTRLVRSPDWAISAIQLLGMTSGKAELLNNALCLDSKTTIMATEFVPSEDSNEVYRKLEAYPWDTDKEFQVSKENSRHQPWHHSPIHSFTVQWFILCIYIFSSPLHISF